MQRKEVDMSGVWREDDEPWRMGGGRSSGGATRSKPRFTFTEVKLLLDEVKRNRYILLRRFNNGVSADAKKQTWTEITELINDLGENHREVRQIMKKWADLKCDGKRRIAALRGTNSSTLKKKTLGPVERMVHKILLMAPGSDNNSDLEWDDDDEVDLKKWQLAKGAPPPATPAFSYLSTMDNNPLTLPGGNSFDASSFDVSPLSTPEKDASDPFHASSDIEFDPIDDDFDADDKEMDSLFTRLGSGGPSSSASLPPLDPLHSSGESLKFKPTRHTYSRSLPNPSPRPPLGPPLSTASPFPAPASNSPSSTLTMPTSAGREDAPPPPPSSSATNGTFHPAAGGGTSSSNSVFPLTQSSSSSSFSAPFPPPPPPHSYTQPPPQLPHAASYPSTSAPPRPQLSQMAAQSLQQQHASRLLLSSVSQSLESLAQSVQLLVESQQEFVQESLHMQRETVDILKDFAGTVLAMLGNKAGGSGSSTGQRL